MQSKTSGLLLIIFVYSLALIIGVTIVLQRPFDSLILTVLFADIVATMFIFLVSTLFKNSTIYDPYWSVAPMVMIWAFVDTLNIKTVLIGMVILLWGTRLTLNWVYTFKHLNIQDWRYDYYKEKSGKLWPLVNLFGIHLMPTIVVFLVMVPAFLALQHPGHASILIYLGAGLSIFAVMIQLVSDTQMHRHRASKNQTILQEGLWRFSRHPNYFGEILMWFGVYVMMLSVRIEWLAMIGPLINLVMFISISIPLMERRQRQKNADYAYYQLTTSSLIPWKTKPLQQQEEVS